MAVVFNVDEGPYHPSECRFKAVTCFKYQKTGHMARVRNSKITQAASRSDKRETKFMTMEQEDTQSEEDRDDDAYCIKTTQKGETPMTVRVHINEVGVDMEIDTGASITIMLENTYRKLWANISESLRPIHVKLRI